MSEKYTFPSKDEALGVELLIHGLENVLPGVKCTSFEILPVRDGDGKLYEYSITPLTVAEQTPHAQRLSDETDSGITSQH
jgi:hypothetical protein